MKWIAFLSLLTIFQVATWAGDTGISAPVVLAPGLSVDAARHEVQMEATVCLQKGMLEYLVCRRGTFEHEAVFVTTCTPSLLHTALLVIGTEPFPQMADGEWARVARERIPARLTITVAYEQDGRPQRRRISEFLVDRKKRNAAVPDSWVFTGSFFIKEDSQVRYAADRTGAGSGLIPEGAAVIQFAERSGIPYHGEDQGLEVNPDTTPAVGTRVRLIFTAQGRAPIGNSSTPAMPEP